MPTTINGCGTIYLGKSNRQSSEGICSSCKAPVVLHSYETRLWFSVIFIPVIPLGRKQILDYCPRCTMHRAIAYRQWERMRESTIGESLAKWEANRDDPDAAIEMHATLEAFQKRDEADRLTEALLTKYADVARVQMHLGGWFERRGQSARATACFDRALALDPASLPARRAVAIGCIEQGDLSRAAELLAPLAPPSPAFDVAAFILLAAAWQKQHRHHEAHQIFKMLLSARPALAEDRDFARAMRASERALGIAEPSIPVKPLYRRPGPVVAAALALAILAVPAWNAWVQRHRTVHVVNGLPVPITVEIDGKLRLDVVAQSRVPVRLAEGDHQARVIAPAGREEPLAFSFATGWFDRFFSSPAFFLDPARSALVLWQETVYRARPADGDGRYRWHLGQPFSYFDNVDYLIDEFPRELHLKNARAEISKTRASFEPIEPATAIGVAFTDPAAGVADVLPYAESHLLAAPENRNLLATYNAIAIRRGQAERASAFFEKRLGDRPILVEWHRMYQESRDVLGDDNGLIRRYDDLLAAEPQNSSLLYLRGRIELDSERARGFFERARAADPANAYAWSADGYRYLVTGEFAQSRPLIEQAHALSPNDPSMSMLWYEARMALREFDALETEVRAALRELPLSLSNHLRILQLLVLAGKFDPAQSQQKMFASNALVGGDPGQVALRAQFELAYLLGDFEAMRDTLGRFTSTPQGLEFVLRIEQGPTEGLTVSMAPHADAPQYMELLLALAWYAAGNADRALPQLELAANNLARGTREERLVAALLKQGAGAPADEALGLLISPRLKRLLLVALAERCPEHRGVLLDMAQKLNFSPDFPYHFLNRRISALREPASP